MKTNFSKTSGKVNTNPIIKCKRVIQDPITGRGIPNPDWTPEQEAALRELTKPVKKPHKLKVPLIALIRSHQKKEMPVIFKSTLTPKQTIEILDGYAEKKQSAKIAELSYLSYCAVILKFKKLYPSQKHIGKVINVTRGWTNETTGALEKDNLLKTLYRFLYTNLHSLPSSLFDPSIKEQLAKHFPWIKYFENKSAVAEFTHNLNLRYIYNNSLYPLTDCKGVNNLKETNLVKSDSLDQKLHEVLRKLTGVLCP